MIRLTRAVVAARPWHALALFLLGLLAIAAAVSAPAYARMAQASVAGSDVANAPTRTLSVSVNESLRLQHTGFGDDSDPTEDASQYPHSLPGALHIRGFASVFETTLHLAAGRTEADYVMPDTPFIMQNAVLAYRSGACAHIVLTAGRCVAAPMEVMISDSTAKLLHGGVGSTMQIQFDIGQLVGGNGGAGATVAYIPLGDRQKLSVVGVYQTPSFGRDPYWTGSQFAVAGNDEYTGLVGPDTVLASKPYQADQAYVVYPLPGALDPDRLADVRADLTASSSRLRSLGVTPNSQLPALLEAIAADQKQVAIGPTVAGIPLVVLCWFVIFLAVAQTAQARRPELALLKLRGTGAADRWWLSAAESVVPLAAGAVAGYFAGHLAVLVYGRITLAHPGPITFSGQSLLYAGTALAGALVVGLLALRRDLSAPVAELLRRVIRHPSRWQSAVIVSMVATLAAVAVFEARDNPTSAPTGLVLLGPALIVLSIGLLLGGLLDPVAERLGAFALLRGRLGLGLAALQIGRPRSSRRVVALLTISVGLYVFAVTANNVSTRARDQQARGSIGAARVFTVDATNPSQLLNAVRAVDPDGRFAMAAEILPAARNGAALLAVDSTRLATVAYWPGSGTATAAAQAVRPQLPDPIQVKGEALLVDAVFEPQPDPETNLAPPDTIVAYFQPNGGGRLLISTEVRLQPGAHTYKLEMLCDAGCRLSAISPQLFINSEGAAKLTLTALRSGDGRAVLATGEQLGHWLDASRGLLDLRPQANGLEIEAQNNGVDQALIQPPDQTAQLPVVGAGDSDVQTLPADTGDFFADNVTTTTTLPRLGSAGGLSDLELTIHDGVLLRGATPEVWLNDAAPPDIADRLAKAGLPVLADRSLAESVADAGQRPNALGWRFFVVLGALALALGIAGMLLAATVERRPRAYALRAMRMQGLSWQAVTVSGLIGYLSLVVSGIIYGAGAAVVAWWLDGAYLPIVEGRPLGQGLPGWPSSLTLGWWITAASALLIVAIVATGALARVVRRSRTAEFGGSTGS